jgi:hypothetical protein
VACPLAFGRNHQARWAYCREDDAPAPARAHRGTTSLAAPFEAAAHHPAMTGQTRSVLLGAALLARAPFFRGLPGDSRINARCKQV